MITLVYTIGVGRQSFLACFFGVHNVHFDFQEATTMASVARDIAQI